MYAVVLIGSRMRRSACGMNLSTFCPCANAAGAATTRFDGGHRQVLPGGSMFRSLIGFILACVLPASLALAQVPSASRLDDVIKSGKLRVCTPGDYKPFSYQRPDGGYEGLDIDLVQSAAKALGVEVEMVKTAWPSLMKDFLEKCDVAVGGI